MLASLPPIIPRDAHTLWSPTTVSPPPEPSTTTPANPATQPRRQQPPRNPALAALDAEEEALHARKSNVRRFGATWLRPPGVSKTYQAMVDEAAERAEQEALARREAALAEEQAAAEEEARRRAHGVDGNDGEEGMERDLDEEVPEGSEGDLDDDVPEAGSYEHTDTEESSGEEVEMAQESAAEGAGMTVVQSEWLGGGVVGRVSEGEGDSELVSSPSVSRSGRGGGVAGQARREQVFATGRGDASRLRENQRSS